MIEKKKLFYKSFLFIRHGETNYNAQNIYMGQLDIELNENGKLQAEQAEKILAKEQIDLIFHSPLKRTRQTTAIFNTRNIEMRELENIQERNCGSFQGLSKNHVKQLREKAKKHFFPDDAETDAGFENRVFSAFHKTLSSNIEKNILFVSHGGVFKALLKILNIESFEIKNCQIIRFIASKNEKHDWAVAKIN